MTEPENFLERWSRRKREAADEPVAAPEAKPEKIEEAAPPPPDSATPAAAKSAEPFDIASLPSIESIAAETDVRVFLQKGVPPELTREALRRAWSTDPAIRDFVGLVENGWDFNNPNAMAGFGPIATDDAARLLAQVIGTPEVPKPAEPPVAAAQGKAAQSSDLPQAAVPADAPPQDKSTSNDDAIPLQRTKDIASQKDSDV
jgi:hypothetical protein